MDIKRLEGEKESLEGEKRAEEWCMVEKMVEWRRAVLAAPSPEAGPSRATLRRPERSTTEASCRLGIFIPGNNCAWCIMQESLCLWELTG